MAVFSAEHRTVYMFLSKDKREYVAIVGSVETPEKQQENQNYW